MGKPWFRLYAEFATDPKVQMMSEADQRRFVMLLCVWSQSVTPCDGDVTLHVTGDVTNAAQNSVLHDDELAFQLRISADDWAQTKARFMARGLISEDNVPLAWNKRQYVSDTSNDRVKRWREKQKSKNNGAEIVGVTTGDGNVTPCNVTVTPPDTDTDTDTDTEIESITDVIDSKRAKRASDPKPKKSDFVLPDWISPDDWKDFEEHRRRLRAPMTDRAKRGIVAELEKLMGAGHDAKSVIEQSITRGWAGVFAIKPDSQITGFSGSAANWSNAGRQRTDSIVAAAARVIAAKKQASGAP